MNIDESKTKEVSLQFNMKTIRRILMQTKAHWHLVAGFLVCISLFSVSISTNTFFMKQIIDEGILKNNTDNIILYSIWYGILFILDSLLVFGFIYYAGLLGDYILYDMRKKLFNHLQVLSFSFFDRTPSGWILSRLTSDTNRISELATWMFLDSVWAVTNIIAATIFMCIINWQLALLIIGILPLLIIVALYFKKYIINEYRKVRSINAKITNSYSENISGIKAVKAMVRESRNLKHFTQLTHDMFHASFRAAWLSSMFLPIVQCITAIGVAIMIWSGGELVNNGSMTIGGIKAFASYILFMTLPIQNLARVYANMQQSIASAERVFSMLDTKKEIEDRPDSITMLRTKGEVMFQNVDFSYEAGKQVLTNFSLHVPPGEMIAIVGPTGGGKSTIVNLVSRFYEPTSGNVFIDGKDYRTFTQQSLQSRIGVVLQTPHLFSGTIKENILYGKPGAKDNEIIYASKLAHAHDFIKNLPNEYNEHVGEAGSLLSKGQKQLVSLARTILANPDIIIMDEATSSIDTLTEHRIQLGIKELLKNRTSFIIAHRLSTVRNADRIILIADGHIQEMGTHQTLLEKKGRYFRLYTHQFKSHGADLETL